jgi:HAD superfamily hydrolase (TIGR01490 family)
MRGAAFFDLDGTLLTVNSVGLWLRRERRAGRLRRRDLARAALYFVGYRFSAIDMDHVVRQALGHIRGVPEAQLRDDMHAWWRDEVRPFIAPGSHAVIDAHRGRGEPVVLLTSSSPYAGEMALADFRLDAALTTRFEVVDGHFTGEPLVPICYGEGKVAHAQAWAQLHGIDLASSAFYTDSLTDLPMLERVGRPHVVNPDPRLKLEAWRRGWPVSDWRK